MNYFTKIQKEVEDLGFKILSKDFNRPWGGFLVIDENQSQEFSN
ncbi:MAG: phosphoheptose isomerase, partial [Crocinitomicaceae bacterium]|nr:phosphoheptose isomerase [Crocinitomicaceae bacterium]